MSKTNETLGDLPGAFSLHFNCTNSPACYFNKPMDIELLIGRLGPEFKGADLYDVLRCPECKSRKFLVICTPVTKEYGATASEQTV